MPGAYINGRYVANATKGGKGRGRDRDEERQPPSEARAAGLAVRFQRKPGDEDIELERKPGPENGQMMRI